MHVNPPPLPSLLFLFSLLTLSLSLAVAVVGTYSYGVTMDDLKNFRQLDSMTPGHPENFVTPGIEVSTGPLGQGISNAVGMAIAERHLAATFNKPDCKV